MAFLDRFRKKALAAPGTSSFFLDGSGGGLPLQVQTFAKEGYSLNPVVFACVGMIGQAAASVKLELHKYDAKGDRTVILSDKLLDRLKQPNPTQSWKDFIQEMVAWHRIAGEVFVLRLPEKGPPAELYLMNPAHITVEKAENSLVPKAFVHGIGEGKITYPVDQLTGASQVLHIKTFNPLDPWRGLSPLHPAARAVDTHNAGAKWNAALLNNSARPSGLLELTGSPSEDTIQKLKKFLKAVWSGPENAGDIPVLTGGAKFTPLSHNPKDMDFQNNMGEAAKNTALVFGVPLPLVTMEASTFSNMEAAQERLWTDTVLPLLDVLIDSLSRFLLPLYQRGAKGDSYRLAYNADSVPALEARRERLYKRMAAAVGGCLLTPNEARIEMGFDDVPRGDQLMVPGTLKPLDSLGTDPQPADALAKAMRKAGYSAEEVVKALPEQFGKAA